VNAVPTSPPPLLTLDPVPTLLRRIRSELSADFGPGRRVTVARAPGRLDVMGGIADYTGSMVCEMPLARAAAVAATSRDDANLQVFSFNLHDEHKPFTLRVPLAALADASAETLRREFDEPGRKWAAYLVGCLFVLHRHEHVNLRKYADGCEGVSLAVYSTVPMGAGVSSSAAVEVATMWALTGHFIACGKLGPVEFAVMCQEAENQIAGAPCGVMDQVTAACGEAGKLLRMVCQPHELLPPLAFPGGVRVVGINSNVRHTVAGGAYGRTRCAAFMGHRIILEVMRDMGEATNLPLGGDPMNGYLANLDPDDYKNLFRRHVPEAILGQAFLDRYGPTIDPVTRVEPDVTYAVQHATDHHVLEARRVRRFCEFLEQAAAEPAGRQRNAALDRAGHLMYASHLSYTNDAMLGAPECDLLVQMVREREHAGLYGARITGGGSGGTVAVLCDDSDRADAALSEVMAEYWKQTRRTPDIFAGSSPGAWVVGTHQVTESE
jgi:L-arabinokinase